MVRSKPPKSWRSGRFPDDWTTFENPEGFAIPTSFDDSALQRISHLYPVYAIPGACVGVIEGSSGAQITVLAHPEKHTLDA